MANKDIENKSAEKKKKSSTTSTKKTTSKKTVKVKETNKNNTSKKTTTAKKASNNSTTKKANTKNNVSKKSTSAKTTVKNTTKKPAEPKKVVTKKTNKDLEKTVVIEDIENKINNIVENKNVEIKEQVVEDIKFENTAKLENAKYKQIKKNKHLLAVGVIISLLGIIALIITLIANRIVDKEFISDNAITLMVIASILIECFGAFIIINES